MRGKVAAKYYKELDTTTHKYCSKCKVCKLRSEFHRYTGSPDGLYRRCKECRLTVNDQYKQDNKEELVAKNREYQKLRYQDEGRRKEQWIQHLKRHYNLTEAGYNKLFEFQEGKCAICEIHQSELDYTLVVDHCHENGEVRGLLCRKCNSGLGLLGDTEDMINKALNYLRRL